MHRVGVRAARECDYRFRPGLGERLDLARSARRPARPDGLTVNIRDICLWTLMLPAHPVPSAFQAGRGRGVGVRIDCLPALRIPSQLWILNATGPEVQESIGVLVPGGAMNVSLSVQVPVIVLWLALIVPVIVSDDAY